MATVGGRGGRAEDLRGARVGSGGRSGRWVRLWRAQAKPRAADAGARGDALRARSGRASNDQTELGGAARGARARARDSGRSPARRAGCRGRRECVRSPRARAGSARGRPPAARRAAGRRARPCRPAAPSAWTGGSWAAAGPGRAPASPAAAPVGCAGPAGAPRRQPPVPGAPPRPSPRGSWRWAALPAPGAQVSNSRSAATSSGATSRARQSWTSG